MEEEEPGACYLFHSLETTEATEIEWAALKKRKMQDEFLECGTRKRTGHKYITVRNPRKSSNIPGKFDDYYLLPRGPVH